MDANNIKTQFEVWLKEKGCHEKTSNGRPSTIYEYVKRIDRLCDKLYNSHALENWEKLAVDIGSVLVPYYESSHKEYYIDKYNIKDALEYYSEIAKFSLDGNYLQAGISFVNADNEYFISSAKINQIVEYLRVFDFCLEETVNNSAQNVEELLTLYSLQNSAAVDLAKKFWLAYSQNSGMLFSDLSVRIQYNNKDNIKTKSALIPYYNFLRTTPDSILAAKLKDRYNDDEIESSIIIVEHAFDNIMKCLTVCSKTGKTALQVKSHFPDGHLNKLETASVLEIDYKTLNKLHKVGLLSPNKVKGFYDEGDVNEYLKKHFHFAKESYPEVDYSQKNNAWCNRKDAAFTMKTTERTIYNYTKKGILTYTDYAPQAPRYYKPELKYLADHK